MDTHTPEFKVRLGLFITVGIVIFAVAIFIIGRQKNLFSPVFKISSTFSNVSGLQVGNNIRFSGINVGTVDNLVIINDSTVRVDMSIKKEIKRFIKTNCKLAIGTEGIIGDRLLTITQGSSDSPLVKEGQYLASVEPIETEAIMANLKVTAANAEIITDQLAEIMTNINHGKGTLGRLIQDKTIAENINKTIVNLKEGSKGLDENMEAAKHNIFLKRYFNKKTKDAEKKKKDADSKKTINQKE